MSWVFTKRYLKGVIDAVHAQSFPLVALQPPHVLVFATGLPLPPVAGPGRSAAVPALAVRPGARVVADLRHTQKQYGQYRKNGNFSIKKRQKKIVLFLEKRKFPLTDDESVSSSSRWLHDVLVDLRHVNPAVIMLLPPKFDSPTSFRGSERMSTTCLVTIARFMKKRK